MMQPRDGRQVAATMRDVNNLAFLHRERTRFDAGASELLGVALEPVGGATNFAVDVRELPELRAITVAPNGSTLIGAFVPLAKVQESLPAVIPPDASLANARMRLALHDARVTVFGLGRTRIAPLDELTLAAHELPVSIELPAGNALLGVAERRITTNDGATPLSLGVTVGLRVTPLARFENVRFFIDLDGDMRRAADAEAKLEKQRCDRDMFAEAARLAATAIPANDARSSAAARALVPLALATLRDAFEAARAKPPSNDDNETSQRAAPRPRPVPAPKKKRGWFS
ncbi:MAG: hypothetical protein JO225_00775 [Candidatus Eremiobacteraeota bacterium]|nr:hypothetical protein [Candidatus Eremiobacteraeota bacterium]